MHEKITHPWWKIWVSPRQTIRNIVSVNKNYGLKRLAFAYGFAMCMHIARSMFLGTSYSAIMIVLICLILAFPVGYITLSISSGLFYFTGKWFKGKGNFHEIRSSVFWGNVPSVISSLIWILLAFVYGDEFFTREFMQQIPTRGELFFIQSTSILLIVLGIWSLIIFLHAYGEVQGFSAWMSLLNLVVTTVFWVIILSICVFVTYVLLRSASVAMML